jgi:hypothetical protein
MLGLGTVMMWVSWLAGVDQFVRVIRTPQRLAWKLKQISSILASWAMGVMVLLLVGAFLRFVIEISDLALDILFSQ